MHRSLILIACGIAACGESTALQDAGSPADTGVSFDATVVDAGFPYDGGVVETPDASPRDPATLIDDVVQIEGARTYVHLRGTATSTLPPVVFLNTGPMPGAEYWVEPSRFLLGPGGAQDPNRLLVLFDMRATGRSGFGATGSSTISVYGHVEDLETMLRYVDEFRDRSSPVDIVAHGYGTAVATLFASQNPQAVERMVFIAPFASHIEELTQHEQEWRRRLSSAEQERLLEVTQWNFCLRDFLRCSREVWAIMGPAWTCAENRPQFMTLDFEYLEMRSYYVFVPENLRIEQFDHRDVLTQIQAPTTIISGPCDSFPASAAETYAEQIPNAVHHIIPGTGHFPMVEAPADFERIVREALARP